MMQRPRIVEDSTVMGYETTMRISGCKMVVSKAGLSLAASAKSRSWSIPIKIANSFRCEFVNRSAVKLKIGGRRAGSSSM